MAAQVYDYIHDLRFEDLSGEAMEAAQRLILDLIGVAIGGRQTDLSRIICDHAARHFGGAGARMLFDGRQVSTAGAALAGGMTIDALDAHDGQRDTKGHVGSAALPCILAVMEAEGHEDGRELLCAMVAAYEVGSRMGIALHRTAADYHTSGAWMAVTCAALGARLMGLDRAKTREAMGIAEYHGPRSQMMRCIDHPTMVKDGSGWGAMAGVSAAYLAADGFTGAPAVLVDAPEVADVWADLGARQYVLDQYVKLYPVCRWAQPPLQAVLDLRTAHGVESGDVERIEVATFHESVRLAVRHPKTTEEAQYSTAYPTAVGMVHGTVGAAEVSGAAFDDPEVQRLAAGMIFTEDEAYNAAFPALRIAHATLVLKDGRRLMSEATEAVGDPEAPLSAAQMRAKFHGLADGVVGVEKSTEIVGLIAELHRGENLSLLRDALCAPIG